MKTLTLFPDQQEIVSDVRNAMRQYKSTLLVSPTGSGKTAIATYIIRSAQDKNNKIIFTVPRKSLLEQTSESFHSYGIHHSFIAAGKPYNPHSSVFIGMIDTMARRINNLPDARLVIADEAHFGDNALNNVITHYRKQGAYILGLTASPIKLNGKGMDDNFDYMVQGKTIRWLIDNKRLSDFRYFRGVAAPDLSKIKVSNGDYNQKELSSYMEHEDAIIGDCVSGYKLHCMNKIHITRCTSIKHSQMVAQKFRDDGITAHHIDGETEMSERKRIFCAFADREIKVLTFCDLLNMGVDLGQIVGRDVCIESNSNLRPSKSLASILQFWGRSLRIKPEPAVFCDHVNAFMEFGSPDTVHAWTLKGRDKKKSGNDERAVAMRQCPAANCYYCEPPVPVCSNCGYVFPIESRMVEQLDGELQEISPEQMRRNRNIEQSQAKTLEELIALGKKRGMKSPLGWAKHVYGGRHRSS